ncbi:hypothetical protein BDW60DRAFT_214780 [Aspergillus nidulans var. acristatus]
MKVCPYKALPVLESLSLNALHYKTCPATASVSACCTALQSTFLTTSLYDPSSPAYHDSQATYWRVDNTQFYPSCIVQPRSASDLSIALSVLISTNDNTPQCRFAIRAGGHSTLVGGTNVDYGVTIDLSALNRTVYDEEKRIASIEPGARWKGVYGALAEYGVGVAGGRGGTVGVGGFLVGGGNSHHSALFGFACDSVVNFEIVLPNGTLTAANSTHNPRLFRALKGGSGNFGIVTRFDMETFPQPRNSIWGGIVTYEHDETNVNAQINALVDFTANVKNDPYASLIPLYTYISTMDRPVIVNSLVYTKPFADPYPDAFKPFYLLPNISDTTRQTDLEGLVGELEPESGLHSNFFTVTFANDAAIVKKAVEIQERLIGQIKKVAKSSEWNIKSLYQPLPGLFAEIGRKKGGNVLGLDEGRDYILDLLWLTWDHVDDTALFDWVGETFMSELDDFARSVGGDYPYVYLNYAAESQNPLRSYGEENLELLKALATEYDPQGIFQTQLHGGFKVSLA